MSDTIALWHADHVNFAQLLDLLEGQLDLFHKGESPDYELILDIMFYMTHYPDELHHPKEDLAFARIKQRAADSGRIVDELTEQHALLKESGDALLHALDDIVNDSIITPREHVEEAARAYVADFRRHMHTEETAIFPLAATLLRASDWVAIDAAIRHMDDPLFAKNGEERYAALRRQIAREARVSKVITRQEARPEPEVHSVSDRRPERPTGEQEPVV